MSQVMGVQDRGGISDLKKKKDAHEPVASEMG